MAEEEVKPLEGWGMKITVGEVRELLQSFIHYPTSQEVDLKFLKYEDNGEIWNSFQVSIPVVEHVIKKPSDEPQGLGALFG